MMQLRIGRPGSIAVTLALALTGLPSTPHTQAQSPATASATDSPLRPADHDLRGFPVWVGRDGKIDRVVVVAEGFDLYQEYDPSGLLKRVRPLAETLWTSGVDILVVDFPDPYAAPDEQAPRLSQAIRAAAEASGNRVVVVGYSAGGITARWALSAAEASGSPLPARSLICLDSPHRGAWLHPALQAMSSRYGDELDRKAVNSRTAKALLQVRPEAIRWRKRGAPVLPEVRVRVPEAWTESIEEHRRFFTRLRGLNARGGYPAGVPTYAVALGSREGTRPASDLFHLWLPFGKEWTLPQESRDRQPGSLLPANIRRRLEQRKPLGAGGAYLRTAPTFIPTESALDAMPEEAPPFTAWYARPGSAAPIDHDEPDQGAGFFVLRTITQSFAR